MARIIKRGDIWIANLEPGVYREIHKKRPALIISHDLVNAEVDHVVVIPISSQFYRTIGVDRVLVGEKEGLKKPSVLLPIYIQSIDQQRLVKKIGRISEETLIEVENATKVVLGLDERN